MPTFSLVLESESNPGYKDLGSGLTMRQYYLRHVVWTGALALVLTFLGFSQVTYGQQNNANDLDVMRIRPNFYVIFGAGGNIAVQIGSNGVVLVNTGTAGAA